MVRLRTSLVAVLLLTVCGITLYFLHSPNYVQGGVPFVPKREFYVGANGDRARPRWPTPNNDVAKFWQGRDHDNKGDNPVDDRKEDLSDYSSNFHRVPDVLIANGRANVEPWKDGVNIEPKTAGRDHPSDFENKRPLQDNRKVTLQEDYYDEDDYKDVPVNRMEGLQNNNGNAQPSDDDLHKRQQPQDNPSDFENEPALVHRPHDHQKDYDYDADIMRDYKDELVNRMEGLQNNNGNAQPSSDDLQKRQQPPAKDNPSDFENEPALRHRPQDHQKDYDYDADIMKDYKDVLVNRMKGLQNNNDNAQPTDDDLRKQQQPPAQDNPSDSENDPALLHRPQEHQRDYDYDADTMKDYKDVLVNRMKGLKNNNGNAQPSDDDLHKRQQPQDNPSDDVLRKQQQPPAQDNPSDFENEPALLHRPQDHQKDYDYDADIMKDYKDVLLNRMKGLQNNNGNAQPSDDDLHKRQQPQDNPSDFENEPALLHRPQDHQRDYDYDADIMKDANRMGDFEKDTRQFPPPEVGPQGLQKLPGRNDPPDTENESSLDDTRAALSQNDSDDEEVDEEASSLANGTNISPLKTSDGVPTANDTANISPLKTSDGVPTANGTNISPLKTSDGLSTANDTANISSLKTSDGVPTANGTNLSPLKTSDDVPPANGTNISPLKTPDGVPPSNGSRMSQGFASRDTNSAPVITREGGLPAQTSRSSSFEGVKSETVLQVKNTKVDVDNLALGKNPLLFEKYHAGNKPTEALTDSSAAHRGLTAQNGFQVPEREPTINTIKASLTSQNSAAQDDPSARFGHHNTNDRQKLLEGLLPESANSPPNPLDLLARGSAQSLEQVPQNDHIPSKSAKPDREKVGSTNSGTLQETQIVDGFQKLPSDGDTKWYAALTQSAGRVCISGKQSHNVFVPCSPEQLGPRLLPPESSIIETSTLPKKYNLMPEVSNGHLATVVRSNTIYMNGLYNGANVSSHRARIPSTAAIIATVLFPITSVAKKKYRLDLGRGVFSEVHTGNGFSVEVRRYAHRNLSRLLVTEVVVNRTTSTLPIVLSFYVNAGASSADIDFVQERPGLWNGKTKEAEDAKLTGTIPVSVVYTVVPPTVTFHPSTSGTVTFLTAVSISRDEALAYYNEGLKRIGQGTLFSSHVNQWDALWQKGRLDLTGNVTMATNTYAAQYYLYSALPLKRDTIWPFVGMAPGGLAHGELGRDYLGHVFWDQDTWMFPGIALLHSDLGRIIADTRIRTLNAAKLNARRAGLQGAWYPTESAVTGTDVDPSKVTADYEIHGNADVSWMMRQYLQLTNDVQFLTLGRGYEAMAAIADFWVSRAVYNQTRGAFEIKGVMGPDELHWPVNNSVYTNADAVDSMRTAQYVARLLRQTPKPMWEKVASSMVINYDPIFKYHTEFDNYTRGSQVKQADTVLMGFPHKWNRTDPVFENDLTYYASVTPGGPAMTWSVFAIGWLRLGRTDKAEEAFYKGTWNIQEPFKVWSEVADGGGAYNFHTGMGGYLQSLLFGYVGVDLSDDHLDLNPQLPPSLTAVAVRGLDYMGSSLDIVYDVQQINITLTKAGKPLRLTLMKQKKTFDLVLGSPISADVQPATLSLK